MIAPSWLGSAVDFPDEDLDDLAPPPAEPDAPEPEDADDDDDLPPWHHPDPWTADHLRDAYWERVDALTAD